MPSLSRPPMVARGVLPLAAVVMGLLLSGCTSTPTGGVEVSSSPSASGTVPAVEAVAGTGPTGFPGVSFVIPEGTSSVVVDFECAGGGGFSVELGDSMMLGQAPIGGVCDGTTALAWPITGRTGPTLSVTVPSGVDWVATPKFSDEQFPYDEAVRVDCSKFSDVYSALSNADVGYTHYNAFDESEWAARVDNAAADLEQLASTAQSPLSTPFAQLEDAVTSPGRVVGAALSELTQGPINEVIATCNANQTPLITQAEFGG